MFCPECLDPTPRETNQLNDPTSGYWDTEELVQGLVACLVIWLTDVMSKGLVSSGSLRVWEAAVAVATTGAFVMIPWHQASRRGLSFKPLTLNGRSLGGEVLLALVLSVGIRICLGFVGGHANSPDGVATLVSTTAGTRSQIQTEAMIFIILYSVVLAPVGEEVFFRGYLYGGLSSKIGRVPALLIQATIFGLFHYPSILQAISMMMIGVALGLIFTCRQNLVTPMLTHSLVNVPSSLHLILG